jgi:hypothetical protein
VGIEDGGIVCAQAFGQLPLDFENLVAGIDERLFETLELDGDFFVGDLGVGDDVAVRLAEYEDFPPADSRRNRDSTENPFSRSRCVWHAADVYPGLSGLKSKKEGGAAIYSEFMAGWCGNVAGIRCLILV